MYSWSMGEVTKVRKLKCSLCVSLPFTSTYCPIAFQTDLYTIDGHNTYKVAVKVFAELKRAAFVRRE